MRLVHPRSRVDLLDLLDLLDALSLLDLLNVLSLLELLRPPKAPYYVWDLDKVKAQGDWSSGFERFIVDDGGGGGESSNCRYAIRARRSA